MQQSDTQQQPQRRAGGSFWRGLLFHDGNDWFDLPRTQWQEPDPAMEGPLGDSTGLLRRSWEWLSVAGMHHGTPIFYTLIGVILAIITILEVWAFTIEELGSMLIPVMLVLAVAKFVLVVAFFMHLRFDRRYYTWVFASCMVGGVALFIILLFIVAHHPGV